MLPYAAVLHSHATRVIALTKPADGAAIIERVFGDSVSSCRMSCPASTWPDRCAEIFPRQVHDATLGMVASHQRIVHLFGADVEQAYRRHIELISPSGAASRRTGSTQGDKLAPPDPTLSAVPAGPLRLARLRREVSDEAGAPWC